MMFKKIRNTIKKLGGFTPLILFAALAPGLGVIVLASTTDSWYEPLKNVQSFQILIFFACSAVLAGFSLVPTHAVSLTAGLLFGSVLGSFYAVGAILTASVITYFLTRWILKDKVVDLIATSPKAMEIHRELFSFSGARALLLIILIRLSPIMPFAATNVLLSAAKVRTWQYIVGSLIGLAPRIIIVAIAGSALSKIDLSQGNSKVLLTLTLIATIIVIVLISKISKKALNKIALNAPADS